MKAFMDRFEKIAAKYPDRIALDDTKRRLTYRELETESGKIYSYLKKKGIKKEDRVLMITQRGVGSVSCILGILKAGAVIIPLEDTYPGERVNYIKKDAKPSIVIDQALYEEIIKNEDYLAGHEQTDPHDASYIVYTSGSTGNPKGVVHEYGTIDLTVSMEGEAESFPEFRMGHIAPFYFVVTMIFLFSYFTKAYTIYIVPHDITRNIAKFSKYMVDTRMQGVFLSPSYIRLYQTPSPYLETIRTGSEPANGCFYPGGKPEIINAYGMSESGFVLLETVLDKKYDVAPLGRPLYSEVDVHLRDDSGNRVEGAGRGELCFTNSYTRGYLNLPEKTSEVFVDGVYHSGDLFERDENGMYYFLGRKDDMFKINGNRIEPAEIERQVKDITKLQRVYAKGFQEGGRAYIVVYYLNSQAKELGILENGRLTCDMTPLKKHLPDYMIPAYYIGLDEFPINANGKIDRKALVPPRQDLFQGEYVEPANEKERFFCDAMAKVLQLERVSALDDFYTLGGDSIGAIKMLALCDEGGYRISTGELYEKRTPRKLALCCDKEDADADMEALESQYRKSGIGLSPGQIFHVRQKIRNPDSTRYNVAVLYKLKKDIDPDRFKAAVEKVMEAHPIYKTKLVETDNGNVMQMYDENIFTPVSVRRMSDSEFENYCSTIIKPFGTFGTALYRYEMIITPSALYLFMDHHHLIIDGMSLQLIKKQIAECYKDPETKLPKDFYYAVAAGLIESQGQEVDRLNCDPILNPDKNGPDTKTAYLYRVGKHTLRKPDGIDCAFAILMACAKYNKRKDAALYYAYNGKDNIIKNRSAGMYAVMFPLYMDFSKNASIEEMRQQIKNQTIYKSAHPETWWTDEIIQGNRMQKIVLFNYQSGTLEQEDFAALTEEELKPPRSSDQPAGIFSIGAIDYKNSPNIAYLSYSEGYYEKESIEKFVSMFEEALDAILK